MYKNSNILSINATEKDSETLLHISAFGDVEGVKTLLEKGANVNATNKDGDTPLLKAATFGNVEVLKYLLNKGANAHATDQYDRTPLHIAIQHNKVKVVSALLEKGEDVNATNQHGDTPLYIAAEHNSEIVFGFLLDKGANIHIGNKDGKTPLHIAAELGHVEIFKHLLNKGANVNAINRDSKTPLLLASSVGHVEVVKNLLDRGANVNAADEYDETPLHAAACLGHIEIVKNLLNKGANVNATNRSGDTPLHEAVRTGQAEIVKYLLENGANKDMKSYISQLNALELAEKYGHKEIINFLAVFKQPLPKNITLSAKNTVLIRMWPPIYKGEHSSYAKVLFEKLFHPLDANVGHISISIRNDKGETYISHWPGEDPSPFKSVPGINATLESDIESEDQSFPAVQIMLHSLDTNKMIKKFEQIGAKAPWFIYGNKKTKKTSDKAYSCSSYVYEILSEGGLFNHLLTKNQTLKHTTTPVQVAELAKKAKRVENILYPETKEFFEESMQEYRKELLEKSQDDINAQMAVNEFLKRHLDYHLLYKNYDQDGFKALLHDVYINIENNYSKTLLAIVNSCNLYKPKDFMKQVEALLNRGATLIAKNEKGHNALHLAIRKNNYDCVAMLLERFPKAINSEIIYPKDNSNLQSNSVNSAHFFSTASNRKELPP